MTTDDKSPAKEPRDHAGDPQADDADGTSSMPSPDEASTADDTSTADEQSVTDSVPDDNSADRLDSDSAAETASTDSDSTGAETADADDSADTAPSTDAEDLTDDSSGTAQSAEGSTPDDADDSDAEPLGADSLWEPDDEAPYAYVRRTDPGWDLSKWLIAAAVVALFVVLSFIMIPKVFSPQDEPAAATSSAAPPPVATSAAAEPPPAAYRDVVIATGPTSLWEFPYGDQAGQDSMGALSLSFGKDVSVLGSSAVAGGPAGALDCSGTSRAWASTDNPVELAGDFSIEVWINTTTASGGQVVSFGTAQEGASKTTDRTIYTDGNGMVHFGVRGDRREVLSGDKLVNDGTWHHIVATMSVSSGTVLYIDGEQVDDDAESTSVMDLEGHWRICGDSLAGWPKAWGAAPFVGTVDEVAVYARALSADEVLSHYSASR